MVRVDSRHQSNGHGGFILLCGNLRSTLRVAPLLLFMLLPMACQGPNKIFVETLHEGWEKIEPYAEFGVETDDGLTEDERRIIKAAIGDFGVLIDEALLDVRDGG